MTALHDERCGIVKDHKPHKWVGPTEYLCPGDDTDLSAPMSTSETARIQAAKLDEMAFRIITDADKEGTSGTDNLLCAGMKRAARQLQNAARKLRDEQ